MNRKTIHALIGSTLTLKKKDIPNEILEMTPSKAFLIGMIIGHTGGYMQGNEDFDGGCEEEYETDDDNDDPCYLYEKAQVKAASILINKIK